MPTAGLFSSTRAAAPLQTTRAGVDLSLRLRNSFSRRRTMTLIEEMSSFFLSFRTLSRGDGQWHQLLLHPILELRIVVINNWKFLQCDIPPLCSHDLFGCRNEQLARSGISQYIPSGACAAPAYSSSGKRLE